MQLWQSVFGLRRPLILQARVESLHSIGGALKAHGYVPNPRYLTGKPLVVTARKREVQAYVTIDKVIQMRRSA